ncbi:lysosome-associated membrane glycoprotein 3 isoform X2 [Phyllobates terribilis]|uniref:lysosome-associated membrane glycoprotein 3 isoform X2 n=1 Tax=Phyllobates terribilis TaxID=111132 RepID=UPI003CCB6782
MASLTLICFLLFSGTFLVDTSAQTPSTMLKVMSISLVPAPNTTTHAPSNTTTHAPSNTTTHAKSNTTTHAPSNTTTHAPSNTTTHAPSNTTTHAPSNTTTHAPTNTTTHAPSNTTTHAPSNTTTHAPSNTTTSNTTSHTTHVIPTLPPTSAPPEIGNYTVKDGKGACIIADMGLELELDISMKGKKDKRYFNIKPKETNANGTCADSKSNLFLKFPEGFINFIFVKEGKTYYIEEVSVQLDVASPGRWNGTSGKLKLLSTDVGYSVACKRTPKVKLGDNMELLLAEVKLQAFDITDGKLGKEEMCSYDRNFTAVIIAVVVIAIIIIAIAVYFIWHKRKSSGYQQI